MSSRAARQRWRAKNPEKCAAMTRKWQRAHPEKMREARCRWHKRHLERARELGRSAERLRRARNPEKTRANGRQATWKRKGIAFVWSDFVALLASQNFTCANTGCTRRLTAESGQLDHDHKTQTVRGVLCRGCNTALGHVNDEVAKLVGLIQYLEKTN